MELIDKFILMPQMSEIHVYKEPSKEEIMENAYHII